MYDEKQMSDYISIIKKRMGISDKEFDEIMSTTAHQHTDYNTDKLSVVLRRFLG